MCNLRRLTPLMSSVTSRTARDALVEVVSGLAHNSKLHKQTTMLLSLAAELDTWDPQRTQEPDHGRRHDAYGKLNEVVGRMEHVETHSVKFQRYASTDAVDSDLLALLAHSHAFTVLNVRLDKFH